MKEQQRNPNILLEISKRTTALYPEFSRSTPALIQEFLNRCKLTGKIANLSVYGSPNHGDLYWKYTGSPIYTYKEVLEGNSNPSTFLLDFTMHNLCKNTAALFCEYDIDIAIELGIFMDLTNEQEKLLKAFVSQDSTNGILLVTMAQS